MPVFTILSNGNDWEAFYIEGKKVLEGHKLSYSDIIYVLTDHRPDFVEVDPDDDSSEAFPEVLDNV